MIKSEVCGVANANLNVAAAEEMAKDWLYVQAMQGISDKASSGGDNAIYGTLTNLALSNDYAEEYMKDLLWEAAKPSFVGSSTFDELCAMATNYAQDAITDIISLYQ